MANAISGFCNNDTWFRVRPKFLVGCVAVLFVTLVPLLASDIYILKKLLLLCAVIAILLGWLFFILDPMPNSRWRTLISYATAVYLTVSVPVFLFELSQIRWLLLHPMHHWISMYVKLWVRHGYNGFFPVLLGVVGSFFGSGKARAAFLLGSIVLLTLRLSSGTWVY